MALKSIVQPRPTFAEKTDILLNQRATEAGFQAIAALDWIIGSGITVTNNGDGTLTLTAASIGGSGTAGRVVVWSGESILTSFADFLFADQSGSGTDTAFTVANSQNNSGADAIINIQVAGSSAGDAKIVYLNPGGGAETWSHGVDNDGAGGDPFVISRSGNLGTTDVIILTSINSLEVPNGFIVARGSNAIGVGGSVNGAITGGAMFYDTAPNPNEFIIRGQTTNETFVIEGAGGGSAKIDFRFGSTTWFRIDNGANLASFLSCDVNFASGKVLKMNAVQVLTAQQTGLGASLSSGTAGALYTGTEQTMLQDAHDKIRLLEAKLKTHGLVAT